MLINISILAHDSNENLASMSYTSDVSNPPSRRNSIGANDYNQVKLHQERFNNKLNIFFFYHRMINWKMVYEHINLIDLLILII